MLSVRRALLFVLALVFVVPIIVPPVLSAAPVTQAKPTIRRGDTGPLVREAQSRLNIWIARARPAGIAVLPVTGTFGPATEAAVRAFQSANGLPAVGFVGPQTWAKLPALTGAVPAAPAAPANAPVRVGISFINFDGAEYRTEGDEYAVIKNYGAAAVNLRGFRLYAGDPGQNFYFPSFVLQPGATVAVYTNAYVRGAFTFGIGRAIWNNAGDCGYLFNAAGAQVDDYCY
jgi:hypothetical protein